MFSPSLHVLGRTVYHLPGKVTLSAPNAVLLLPGNLFRDLPAMCNLPFSVQARRNGSVSNAHSQMPQVYTLFFVIISGRKTTLQDETEVCKFIPLKTTFGIETFLGQLFIFMPWFKFSKLCFSLV